jgi:hypothetical protein
MEAKQTWIQKKAATDFSPWNDELIDAQFEEQKRRILSN